jgi:hypothetical protein
MKAVAAQTKLPTPLFAVNLFVFYAPNAFSF